MRDGSTFRAARRNECREQRHTREGFPQGIRLWRYLQWAARANETANLKGRAKACADARVAVALAITKDGRQSAGRALTEFWQSVFQSKAYGKISNRLQLRMVKEASLVRAI